MEAGLCVVGGTSSDATLQVDNIRFCSLQQPRLEIVSSGSGATLSWPSTAAGSLVESSPDLGLPVWQAITNPPMVSADRYILTNAWSDQTRFFRLRPR